MNFTPVNFHSVNLSFWADEEWARCGANTQVRQSGIHKTKKLVGLAVFVNKQQQ
jgi:hypothetical protein